MAEMRQGRQEGLDVSALIGFIRRRGLILLLAVAVGAVAGYAISDSKDPEYSASATLLLRGESTDSGAGVLEPGVPGAPEDRQNLVRSDGVMKIAHRRLQRSVGRRRADELLSNISVFSGQDTSTVEITGTAGSARGAALAANAVGAAVVEYRRVSTIARMRRAQRAAERQLSRLSATDAAAPGLQTQISVLRQAAVLEDGHADITSRATPPASPSSPKPTRDAVIGGFAGLLLGLMLGITREQLDRRVKHSKELEDIFGLPVLASVRRSRALAASNGRALEKLPPSDAEAFQMLRANLRFLNTEMELRSVVVTSPGVGDGKSTVALNLAKADASVGKKVLLIEADMRRPRLGNLLGLESESGLTDYISNSTLELTDVARRVPVVQQTDGGGTPLTMDVVLAGSVPPNPSELINSERMGNLVRRAEDEYDLVVIDTAPAGLVADAIPLMSQATAVVIVGRVGRITGSEAGSLREQLERIDAPAFGLVANFARSEAAGYGYAPY